MSQNFERIIPLLSAAGPNGMSPASLALDADLPLNRMSTYICAVKKYCGIPVYPIRNGRNVVAYSLVAPNSTAGSAVAYTPKVKAPKVVKAKAPKVAKAKAPKAAKNKVRSNVDIIINGEKPATKMIREAVKRQNEEKSRTSEIETLDTYGYDFPEAGSISKFEAAEILGDNSILNLID